MDSSLPATPVEGFRSLIERSINAWSSNIYVGEGTGVNQNEAISKSASALRALTSMEALLESREFYFFQDRASFIKQNQFKKWSSDDLEGYILIPKTYGFLNNREFIYVSHYWRTKEQPDPEAIDFRKFRSDMRKISWSYAWMDWTCLPQAPRNEIEEKYFQKMLRNIPALIRDCGFQWRYPRFHPRAWVLYEIADFYYNHDHIAFNVTDDIVKIHSHIKEMLVIGVREVVNKYGYKCTVQSDLEILISWMKVMTILYKINPDVTRRQQVFESISRGRANIIVLPESDLKITIDKDKGIISHAGKRYNYTPLPPYHLV